MEWTPFPMPPADPLRDRGEWGEGVHLTQIRSFIKKKLPFLTKGRAVLEDDPAWDWAASVGFAFEDSMAQALASYCGLNLIRGMTLQRDGILMSPDGIDPERWELWEFKFTWKGLHLSPPHEIWDYLVQVMGYLRELGPNVDGEYVCNLIVFYPCGNYKPPTPTPMPVRLVFTAEEIENNWRMFTQSRDMMRQEGLIP